jgi:hypothetical protein
MLGVRYKKFFKDLKLNNVFHSDVNGAFNILKVRLKIKKLFKSLTTNTLKKLCNHVKNNMFKFCKSVLSKATSELFYTLEQ